MTLPPLEWRRGGRQRRPGARRLRLVARVPTTRADSTSAPAILTAHLEYYAEAWLSERRSEVLDSSTYVQSFRRDTAALADVASRGLEAPVPSCPGWTVTTLVTHLTGIYAHRARLLRVGDTTGSSAASYGDLGLPPELESWFAGNMPKQGGLAPIPPNLLDLIERTADGLAELMASVSPDMPVWTWWPPDQTAGFWQRRMAHETAVHRWDAELAFGAPQAIEPELARDGVDEVFDVMAPASVRWAEDARPGAGETYHLHRTDGEGEWLVRFEGKTVKVTREHAKGDVAARGTASELLLFLWGRIGSERLEVLGDAALLDRYFELVPPD